MKLWQKKFSVNKEVEAFTVGDDYLLDEHLIFWDCMASSAHANMLSKIGILSKAEYAKIKKTLSEITKLQEQGKFSISQEDEDCHTAIENHITKKLGDSGKKIHTARSRNDQVLVATRLYTKAQLQQTIDLTLELLKTCQEIAEKHKNTPMPGYTHMQKAMPSSVGLFFGSYCEALLDNLTMLKNAYNLNNQNPLGSAAGYGTQFNVDRKLTTKLLGFDKVQNNVMYCQNSRGKIEGAVVHALMQIMQDCAKLANDLLLFSMPHFQYFSFPKEFTTGSSIMPQKRNLDIFELVRAKASTVQGKFVSILTLTNKAPSGYNRDYQLLKKHVMEAFSVTQETLAITNTTLQNIHIHEINCKKDCTPELFATDYANKLVQEGMPFRDAYKKVAAEIHKLKDQDPIQNIKSKKHLGATGNLGLDSIKKSHKEWNSWLVKEGKEFEKKAKELL